MYFFREGQELLPMGAHAHAFIQVRNYILVHRNKIDKTYFI